MGERKLSDAIGADESAVEGLARAGVQTVEQLAAADPEAVAMASGIPVDRIRDWQHRAKRATTRPGMSPVAKGWLAGLIAVLLALIVGWALIAIGSAKIRKADEVRLAAESKLELAVSFAAEQAIDELRRARLALRNNNWGDAQSSLLSVQSRIALLEGIAPDRRQSEVGEVRQLMDDLQRAVAEESTEASEKLDSLEAALDKLRQTSQ